MQAKAHLHVRDCRGKPTAPARTCNGKPDRLRERKKISVSHIKGIHFEPTN